jgi:hypothetical protein
MMQWGGVAALALAATLSVAPTSVGGRGGPVPQEAELTAAFLFNFAKFTEWPTLSPGAPIIICVADDGGITAAVIETVRNQRISSHALEVRSAEDSSWWRSCHVLFVPASQTRQSAAALSRIEALPVLTVSDGAGFSRSGGIIELYVEDGRMRFAINVTAVERSGLRLSSRLLGLARIVRVSNAP